MEGRLHELFIILMFCHLQLYSQEESDIKDAILSNRIEFLVMEDLQSVDDYSELYDELEYYMLHPININLNVKVLEEIGLLSAQQGRAIEKYRQTNGDFILIYELQSIPEMDKKSIQRIRPFITFSGEEVLRPSSSKKTATTLMIRSQMLLERQNGFEEPKEFIGDRSKQYLRFRSGISENIVVGLALEKDIGERFSFDKRTYGYDHHSFFVRKTLKNDNYVIAGDYLVNIGQGMLSWSATGRGKSADVLQIKKVGRTLRETSSANESNYYRGIAYSASFFKSLNLSTYFSRKRIDAKLDESGNHISSLPKSGYHRTESEISAKKQGVQENYGVICSIVKRSYSFGMALSKHMVSIGGTPASDLLQSIGDAGQYHSTIFFDTQILNFNFFGEIVRDNKNSLSGTYGLLKAINKEISLAFQMRHSGRSQTTETSAVFSESGTSGNELGIYSALSCAFTPQLKLNVYMDLFKFPSSRFQADGPSQGSEWLLQLSWEVTDNMSFIFRSKKEIKEKNYTDILLNHSSLHEVSRGNNRFEFRQVLSDFFTLKYRLETSSYSQKAEGRETGLLLIQDFRYRSENKKFGIDLRLLYFNTQSYNTRIYTYENDVLYAFSIPAFSGRGNRNYLMLQYKISRKLKLWLRYARTTYFDRNVIGSGLNEISGNVQSEVKAQVRVGF